MTSKIKYITIAAFQGLYHDAKHSWQTTNKPVEVMNMLFWLTILFLLTGNMQRAIITFCLYPIAYIWKVVRQGYWRKMYNDAKKQKLIEDNS